MEPVEPVVDFAEAQAPEEFQRRITTLDRQLARASGAILGTVSNMILIVGGDPALDGLCGFHEFLATPVLLQSPPAPLADAEVLAGPYPRLWKLADVVSLVSYIQRVWTQQARGQQVEEAMQAVAAMRRFHPGKD